ncbi:MAG: radical SAM protein, partial [Candidatus Kapaibacteriota bacterium]
MENSKNISVLTLGCPKNVVDSEKLISALGANGFTVVDNIDKSETCIINTCGFIKPAVEENLEVILKVVNLKVQGKLQKVIVAGCLVERFKEILRREFNEVDLFVGVESLEQVVRYLKSDAQLKSQLLGERQLLTPKHYAYLKVSEGCNRECAFCAIPNIRGRLRSIPIPNLVEEATSLARKGVRELIIVSQDTSSYGIDIYGEPKLLHLLKELVAIPGISWIRIMYLYPAGIPDGLIDFVAHEPKICNYFDIPIQHIS